MGKVRAEAWYNNLMKKSWGTYSKGRFALRDRKLAEMLVPFGPKNILEVCGAEGNLAKCILENCPTLKRYLLTDFSTYAVERMRRELPLPRLEIEPLDIDKNYGLVAFSQFDTFVCTALEHVQHDRKILASIKPSTLMVMSLPRFNDAGHVRHFPKFKDVEARYGDLMSFLLHVDHKASGKILFIGRRKR